MISVYQVLPDAHYQYLEPVVRGTYPWRFDGSPIEDRWKPPEMYSREPMLEKPDIWGIPYSLAFEAHAMRYLGIFLDQTAEQFVLPFEGRELIVPNITYVLNCLDTKRSRIDPVLPHVIHDYVFHAERMDYTFFKIPQTRHSQILTVEGLSGPDDEFKSVVEKYDIKGLKFRKLWSSGD